MSAREEILSAIRSRKTGAGAPAPQPYRAPAAAATDLAKLFSERAAGVAAEVRMLDRMEDVPAAIADLLRARNLAASIHVPPDAALAALPFTPALEVKREPPGPEDSALAIAPFAIAETGTLVYPSRPDRPASWHFRPGFEIGILKESAIVPRLEDALEGIRSAGVAPHTINLVTGPSRTGDIEQTLELGAHGPKALAVLIVRGG